MARTSGTNKPFHSVYTAPGAEPNFVDGYDTKAEADANVTARNAEAKSLGLSGSYSVVDGPRCRRLTWVRL